MGRNWGRERQRKEGRWHLGAQSPERQEAGMGRGLCLVAPVLGLLQSRPLPGCQELLVRSRQRGCEKRGRRRGGQGSLDKPAHTRQMFAQKNTGKSSCKYNRESACSHRWLLRLLASSVLPIRCEEGLGQVWGIGGGLLCISMRAPSPPLPRRTVLSLHMSPPK